MTDQLFGAVEAGGTKFICAIGSSNGNIVDRLEITTGLPDETLQAVIDYFKSQPPIVSLGIASFGPVDIDPRSKTYGYITHTPKSAWANTDILGILRNEIGVNTIINTDVNCAALGELHFGLGREIDNFVYITVGTGIGGGIISNKELFGGNSHPEIGHMRIPEAFELGSCNIHGNCLEGVASGAALKQYYGQKAEFITDETAWEQESRYLAYAINNLVMILSPQLFILGGGVMKHAGLIEAVRKKVAVYINDYIAVPDLEKYIVRSENPDNALQGAIYLASNT